MTDSQSPSDISSEQIPDLLPILPLFDATLFPKMVLPLVVMKGESVHLIDEAMARQIVCGAGLTDADFAIMQADFTGPN